MFLHWWFYNSRIISHLHIIIMGIDEFENDLNKNALFSFYVACREVLDMLKGYAFKTWGWKTYQTPFLLINFTVIRQPHVKTRYGELIHNFTDLISIYLLQQGFKSGSQKRLKSRCVTILDIVENRGQVEPTQLVF